MSCADCEESRPGGNLAAQRCAECGVRCVPRKLMNRSDRSRCDVFR